MTARFAGCLLILLTTGAALAAEDEAPTCTTMADKCKAVCNAPGANDLPVLCWMSCSYEKAICLKSGEFKMPDGSVQTDVGKE